jgi:hypothetical protein
LTSTSKTNEPVKDSTQEAQNIKSRQNKKEKMARPKEHYVRIDNIERK